MDKKLIYYPVIALIFLFVSPFSALADLTWTGCGISKKAYMTEMAKAFQKETGVKIKVSGGGATKGIRDTASGKADMGGTCRHLILDTAETGIKLYPVGWDALVVIANPKNPVKNISSKNLQKVFSGKITNWKQLGGPNKPIQLYVRKGKISGVGLMARELIFGNSDFNFKGTKEFPSSGPLEKAIEKEKYAIGITGISSAKKRKVKILQLNGVESTVQNISKGKYLLYRPLYIVAPVKPKPEVKKFLSFINSAKGRKVMEAQGTVTLKQGSSLWKPYRKNMTKVTGSKKGIFD